MNRGRLLTCVMALIVLLPATYFVGGMIYIWKHVPEAYAAWDAGTLLVGYMEKHGGDWPEGWSDLEQLHHDEPQLRLRWNAHEPGYFESMRKTIAIDWGFDPSSPSGKPPVTSADGSPLVCLWASPNAMVRRYLDAKESTGATDSSGNVPLSDESAH